MKHEMTLSFKFVEYIPESLEDGVIYISLVYATAAHNCCCGCGNEVNTPFSPTDWKLIFDGESISLDPSIGNWNLPCRSHYWIRRNKVTWASQWTQEQIQAARGYDAFAKQQYYADATSPAPHVANVPGAEEGKTEDGVWQKLKKWFGL
ncbi:MAG TPA: DUF6527 family protein [Symbiobacteriaceae bacterium]|jgi:hypothetical protein